jgi:hypothetical protein
MAKRRGDYNEASGVKDAPHRILAREHALFDKMHLAWVEAGFVGRIVAIVDDDACRPVFEYAEAKRWASENHPGRMAVIRQIRPKNELRTVDAGSIGLVG